MRLQQVEPIQRKLSGLFRESRQSVHARRVRQIAAKTLRHLNLKVTVEMACAPFLSARKLEALYPATSELTTWKPGEAEQVAWESHQVAEADGGLDGVFVLLSASPLRVPRPLSRSREQPAKGTRQIRGILYAKAACCGLYFWRTTLKISRVFRRFSGNRAIRKGDARKHHCPPPFRQGSPNAQTYKA